MDTWVCYLSLLEYILAHLSVHSGGYALGSISKPGLSSMTSYDGNDLIRDSGGNVIAVLIQYRLGLFGFLAGSDVKRDGVLNAGLRKSLDQRIRWVVSDH